ncbi:prominin-like protein isoform X5 [Apis mellifera]|uniref:Prominin-like protein isoform X5 n=1 Tax=Apis mellifera TaxID=7460 RepID=A0A7M7FZ85_APIME|nr:prominin-like protein isoform X5 [Apis mellifera]|eukprot:XP_001122309.4 prominin-like protein isoform X5 [Apis mellifera]
MVRFRVPPKRTEASVRSDASRASVAAMIFVLFCGFRPNAVVHYGFAVLGLLSVLLVSCPVNCQETLTNRMRVISEDLDRQLNGIMASQGLNYTTINTTGLPYNATTKFNPKGMGQLYNVTNTFIDWVQTKQAYPEGMFTVVNGRPTFQYSLQEWRIVATHYGGLAGLTFVGLLLAAILPCVGLFFCCCRCAGHCGARSQPFDKKHDHCRKVLLSMVLIAVATIILFGVVCAFVTNEYMQDGTKELPNNVEVSLKDVKLYLSSTKEEINKILKTNFDELEINLNNILQASGRIVTEQLAEYSHAVSLTNLSDIVAGLESIKEDLKTMQTITRDLRTNASQLDIVVRGVKNNLLHTLAACKTQNCKQVLHDYKVNQMSVQVDFDKYMDRYFPKLPNVTSALNNITMLMKDNIVSEVSQGKESFLKIQKDIQYAVNQTIPVVSASIRNAGDFLADLAKNMTMLIDRINNDIDKVYMKQIDVARTNIDQYSPYRYYLGLGISGILLTVLMCLTFGLFCGICGKRPDGYGDDCCNKGSGARFLMMAVWIIFLLTSILMVITVIHMVVGVLAQRAVCEPLKNPQDNRMFALVDEIVQIKKILYPNKPNADVNMSYIITNCHRNETLYKVLKLNYLFDVNTLREYTGRYDINNTIQQLRRKISLSPGVVILTESAKSKLNDLAQSGLSDIKFYQYVEILADNITNINLEHLAKQLLDVSTELPKGQDDIRASLEKNALDLAYYHEHLVKPMAMLSEQLAAKAVTLEEKIKFNHSSMAEAIHNLVDEVTKAQKFLNEDGPEYVQQLATKFGNAFLRQVDDFLERVIDHALFHVGKCTPVSNAYNATLVAGCSKILDPFNGFWVSVGWCLILFIPTIVLCVKLSALYQKSDPYPGPLVEAEYLYDAYADRDNIPLTHVHDKKYVSHSRDPYAKYESYDGPAGGYSDRERVPGEAHQSTSHYHHYSRYSDVAPNSTPTWRSHEHTAPSKKEPHNKVFSISVETQNCDFPNGGPPGYQPAAAAPPPLSTEYERPPPYYYYPGPGDTN